MASVRKVTSRSNALLTHVRKIRDGRSKDRIFLEGTRLIEEALRSPVVPTECIVAAGFSSSRRAAKLVLELLERGISITEVPSPVFASVADTANSQGIIVIAERPRRRELPAVGTLFVFLHRISDPANLGAVLRTAEAAGVDGIILSTGSADTFSPKALRAGMGSNLRLEIFENIELGECIEWARGRAMNVTASHTAGDSAYTHIDWRRPSLIVFGSEAHGLGPEEIVLADETFRIPMVNGVESLNLAVAAGIVLFEAVRQRSSATP